MMPVSDMMTSRPKINSHDLANAEAQQELRNSSVHFKDMVTTHTVRRIVNVLSNDHRPFFKQGRMV